MGKGPSEASLLSSQPAGQGLHPCPFLGEEPRLRDPSSGPHTSAVSQLSTISPTWCRPSSECPGWAQCEQLSGGLGSSGYSGGLGILTLLSQAGGRYKEAGAIWCLWEEGQVDQLAFGAFCTESQDDSGGASWPEPLSTPAVGPWGSGSRCPPSLARGWLLPGRGDFGAFETWSFHTGAARAD